MTKTTSGDYFCKETEVKAEPNLRSETSFTLHEGHQGLVIEDL